MENIIKDLAKKRNAIILAHNYQPPEIQNIADICGDSLELSIKATEIDADVIVFCGVRFMAETASILSPNKTILLPNSNASCPMVDMVNLNDLKKYHEKFPTIPIVTYVNSSAKVKAISTICCTSANSGIVVNSLKSNEVLMIPDRNLAINTKKLTKKKIHFWEGYCPIHANIKLKDAKMMKKLHPNAIFMAHPECNPDIIKISDVMLSTSGMINYANKSKKSEFIVATETGLLYPMKQKNPNKSFYPVANYLVCPDMKMTTLTDVVNCLKNMKEKIKIERNIRLSALKALTSMIKLSK